MKILISGGHLTPALAFIDFVQAHHSQDEIAFVGRKFSQAGNLQTANEQTEITKRHLPFYFLDSPKLQHGLKHNLSLIKDFYSAINQAKSLIDQIQPDVMLSFGGYVALPLAIAAHFKKIPVVTHEQTMTLGIANRLIGLLAQKIALSYEPKKLTPKTIVTGNPLRPNLLKSAPKPSWFATTDNLPILYITGGNQGSHFINNLVAINLPILLSNFIVIHSTGKAHLKHHDYQDLVAKKSKLSPVLQQRYCVREWVDEIELAWILNHANLAISRSGANSVQELGFFVIPTLFIPLPIARLNEQFKSAEKLAKAGAAIMLDQANLQNDKFLDAVFELKANQAIFKNQLKKIKSSLPIEASQNLYRLLTVTLSTANA